MSIRNRILVFSILATLIPAVGMGWLLNYMLHVTLTEKVEQQLIASSNIIDQEIALWFKERSYDLYVFSNSFVISENFTKYLRTTDNSRPDKSDPSQYIKTMETYLTSVQKQFTDFARLFVLTNDGFVVAASNTPDKTRPVLLPDDAAKQILTTNYLKGEVYFDEENNSPLMLIGIPLFAEQSGGQAGILAIEVRLQGILPLLHTTLLNTKRNAEIQGSLVSLLDNRLFLSTDSQADRSKPTTISDTVLQLFDNLLSLQEFSNPQGIKMVGIFTPLKQFHWGLIIAEEYKDVYAQAIKSRNRNILIACSLGLLMGLIAYLFAKQILTPLTALTRGAQSVAEGNLSVRLPLTNNDELGFAIRVFNDMVAKLQQSQIELEALATTDALTGLANRKQIMKKLFNQFSHFQRYKTEFSLLMIDVDHFKKINDTYGHPAGDAVLRQLAEIFIETLRSLDSAGRYGGEEFLVIIAESFGEKAQQVAERIRQAVENHTFVYEKSSLKVNISIGVTTILVQDENEHILIRRADQALYQAKRNGRNQVAYLPNSANSINQNPKVVSLLRSVEE